MVNKRQTTILCLGDVHVGAKTFNEELFERWLSRARTAKRKGRSYILLNGDLIDFQRASQDAWGSTMSATEQIDYIVEALEPYQELILGATSSNHGSRAYKEFNMDIDELIANKLNVPFGYDMFADIPFNSTESKRVFWKHGTRFSKSYLLFFRNFINDMSSINADAFFVGHAHFGGHQTRIIREADGISKKEYIANGSFLSYKDSYANKQGFDLNLACFPVVSIDEQGNCNCKVEYEVI